jgi:hypothetical protein
MSLLAASYFLVAGVQWDSGWANVPASICVFGISITPSLVAWWSHGRIGEEVGTAWDLSSFSISQNFGLSLLPPDSSGMTFLIDRTLPCLYHTYGSLTYKRSIWARVINKGSEKEGNKEEGWAGRHSHHSPARWWPNWTRTRTLCLMWSRG